MTTIRLLNVQSRNSDILSDLESFLDDNTETMPPALYDQLVQIYDGLNDSVSDIEVKLEEANNDLSKLQQELDAIEGD